MNVPVILGMGGAEFAKIGKETSTGTKLISISGQVKYPGNYEIVLGTKVRDILHDLAGGPLDGQTFKAFFPGGSSSPVLPLTEETLDLDYDFDTLAKAGSMLGSGALIVFDESTSIVDVAYKTAHFYRHESCGKCSPCREGTNWTEKMLLRIKNGDATPMDLDIMASVCEQIMGNCLCVLGDAMAMPIGSMIKHFREEFETYIEAAREKAGFGAAIPQVNRGANAGPGPLLHPLAAA
jgi:NADH-quinone oxidoreductase subunit F